MKKFTLMVAIICFNLLFICAEHFSASENLSNNENKSILDVIREQGDIASNDIIFNEEYYDDSLIGQNLTNDTILKVYCLPMWCYVTEDVDSIASIAEEKYRYKYVDFRETPIKVLEYKWGEETRVGLRDYETIPTYVVDIMNSAIYDSALTSPEANYSRVMCFDAVMSHEGIVVYYVNGADTVVYYYEDYSASPLEFTLKDFQIYGNAYYKHCSSYENNYNEAGDLVGGDMQTFATFLEEFDMQEYMEKEKALEQGKCLLFIVLGIVIVASVFAVIFYRGRKKCIRIKV